MWLDCQTRHNFRIYTTRPDQHFCLQMDKKAIPSLLYSPSVAIWNEFPSVSQNRCQQDKEVRTEKTMMQGILYTKCQAICVLRPQCLAFWTSSEQSMAGLNSTATCHVLQTLALFRVVTGMEQGNEMSNQTLITML
jgi:hypothetical protein